LLSSSPGPWPVGPSFQEGHGSLAMLGTPPPTKQRQSPRIGSSKAPSSLAAPSFREWVCRSATHRPSGPGPSRSSLVGCRGPMRELPAFQAPAHRSTGREDRGLTAAARESAGHELLRLERDPAPGAALGRPHRGTSFVRTARSIISYSRQALAPAQGPRRQEGIMMQGADRCSSEAVVVVRAATVDAPVAAEALANAASGGATRPRRAGCRTGAVSERPENEVQAVEEKLVDLSVRGSKAGARLETAIDDTGTSRPTRESLPWPAPSPQLRPPRHGERLTRTSA